MNGNLKFKISTVLYLLIYACYGQSPDELTMKTVLTKGAEFKIVDTQVGNWNVEQKIWNDKSELTATLNHVAKRSYQGNFLEEIMEPKDASAEKFKRITYLNFNNASRLWECIVLDTRYPVMMFESSTSPTIADKTLTLYLPAFIVPPVMVGDHGGELGHQRREVIFESADKTVMKQYWSLPGKKEFLAMQYTYTRQTGK